MQRRQNHGGTDLMTWSLDNTHDVTGTKGPGGFQVFSPHPQIHSLGGCHGVRLLLN